MKQDKARPKIEFHATRGDSKEEQLILSRLGFNEPIRLARDCVPEWYSNLERVNEGGTTVKQCAGIFDFIRAGYILPMWCDMSFKVSDSDPHSLEWVLPPIYNGFEHLVIHHRYEQVKNAPFLDYGCQTIIKLVSPFFIQVPKGVSIFYTVPFYSANQEDYTICSGVIDPEVMKISNREINPFIKLNRRGKTIKFKKGQPLMQIIPFIRSDYDFEVFAPELSELESLHCDGLSTIRNETSKKLDVNRMKDGKSFKCPVMH